MIPNQSVLALTDRTWAFQNCISLILKTKEDPESGSAILCNLFILNNLAERVGFEPTLPFRVNTLSKRAPSATRPSLRRRALGRSDPARSRGNRARQKKTRGEFRSFQFYG